MKYYKFVKWDAIPIEKALESRIPAALQEYDKGNTKPWRDLQIATTEPHADIGGWRFPYSEYLKRYWVKTKYYGILEYYAINKTAIRKELKSMVLEIKEV
jgi:hypothetical protein